MDIQKEREAFEQALVNQKNVSINNLHVCTIFDAEKNKYSPSDVCDPKEDFIVDWINSSWLIWQSAKAQAVPEGFVLVSAEQLSQWGHMANYAEQYGCPECFEARGYAHSLACEINEFFAIEPQEPAND